MQRDAVLEQHHQQERVDRVAQVVRVPLLVLAHPQDAVADVAVLAEDVGVGVVHVVVRVPPLVGRAGGVPLEVRPESAGSRIQSYWPCMTLWPISMLSRIFESPSTRCRPARPAAESGEQQRAAGDLQAALGLDDAADVVGVALAEVGDHAVADGVELAAELVDLLGGQWDRVLGHDVSSLGLVVERAS